MNPLMNYKWINVTFGHYYLEWPRQWTLLEIYKYNFHYFGKAWQRGGGISNCFLFSSSNTMRAHFLKKAHYVTLTMEFLVNSRTPLILAVLMFRPSPHYTEFIHVRSCRYVEHVEMTLLNKHFLLICRVFDRCQ